MGASQYVLFRPNALNNYDVTVQTIPEPGSAALLAAGALALRRRRR